MEFLLLTGIIFITIFSRFYQSFISRKLNTPDHYFHLLNTEEIRKRHHRIPERQSKFLIFNRFTAYPYFYHRILSYLSREFVERYGRYQSALFDILQVIIIFTVTKFYLAKSAGELPYYIPLICSLSYSLYPIFFKVGDARNITLNARPVGELFSNIAIISLMLFCLTGSYVFIIISLLNGTLTFLSSKFGVQAYVFMSILIGLIGLNYLYVTIPAVSFLLAILMSGGKYLQVLNGHITHSYFIYKVRGNPGLGYSILWKFLGILKKNPRNALEELYRFPLFSILIHSPFYLVLIVFAFVKFPVFFRDGFVQFFSIWAVAGFLVVILTSFKKTKFLGEADRYGLYCAMPLAIIAPMFLYENLDPDLFLIIMALYFSLCLIYIYITYRVWGSMPTSENHLTLINYLKSLPPSNCACNPISLSYEMAYMTQHMILFNPPGFGYHLKNYPEDLKLYNELYSTYPLLNKNLIRLKEKYKLDFLILRNKYAYKSFSNIRELVSEYDLDNCIKVYENNDYQVFDMNA